MKGTDHILTCMLTAGLFVLTIAVASPVEAKLTSQSIERLIHPVGGPSPVVAVPEQLAQEIFTAKHVQPTDDVLKEMKSPKFRYSSLFTAEGVDLNGDGKDELMIVENGDKVTDLPMHNGPVWTYERAGKGYRELLSCNGNPRALAAKTGGYRNIVVSQHCSAAETDFVLCKFANGKYHPSQCFSARYTGAGGKAIYTENKCDADCL